MSIYKANISTPNSLEEYISFIKDDAPLQRIIKKDQTLTLPEVEAICTEFHDVHLQWIKDNYYHFSTFEPYANELLVILFNEFDFAIKPLIYTSLNDTRIKMGPDTPNHEIELSFWQAKKDYLNRLQARLQLWQKKRGITPTPNLGGEVRKYNSPRPTKENTVFMDPSSSDNLLITDYATGDEIPTYTPETKQFAALSPFIYVGLALMAVAYILKPIKK